MIKRNTIQRALTLDAVRKLKSHATADDIYAAVAAQHSTISRGTVYRNLKELAESGEILQLKIPDGADRFDHQCHNHYHARCLKCGRVFDVDMDYIEDLEKYVKNPNGFQFAGHDLIFNGLCEMCQE